MKSICDCLRSGQSEGFYFRIHHNFASDFGNFGKLRRNSGPGTSLEVSDPSGGANDGLRNTKQLCGADLEAGLGGDL